MSLRTGIDVADAKSQERAKKNISSLVVGYSALSPRETFVSRPIGMHVKPSYPLRDKDTEVSSWRGVISTVHAVDKAQVIGPIPRAYYSILCLATESASTKTSRASPSFSLWLVYEVQETPYQSEYF